MAGRRSAACYPATIIPTMFGDDYKGIADQ